VNDKPPRKVYSITERGKSALWQSINQLEQIAAAHREALGAGDRLALDYVKAIATAEPAWLDEVLDGIS